MRRTEAPTDTILVVDDNAANRLLVQTPLEDEGYDDRALRAGGDAAPGAVFCVRLPHVA